MTNIINIFKKTTPDLYEVTKLTIDIAYDMWLLEGGSCYTTNITGNARETVMIILNIVRGDNSFLSVCEAIRRS